MNRPHTETTHVPEASTEASRRTNEQDEIDLGQLLDYLLAGKWLIVAVTLLVTLAAGFYAFVAAPVYKSDALLQVEKEPTAMPGLSEISELLATDASGSTEIEILRSRNILGKAVDDLNLTIKVRPEHFPVIGEALARRYGGSEPAEPPAFTGWFDGARYAWGGEVIEVDRFEISGIFGERAWRLEALEDGRYRLLDQGEQVLMGRVGKPAQASYDGGDLALFVSRLEARPGTRFALGTISRQRAVQELRSTLSVSEAGQETGILRLALEGTDPERIQNVLDSIANHYVRQNVERKSQEAQNMLDFIERQLPELRANLETAEARLNEYRQVSGTVDLSLEAQEALSKMTELEARVSQLEMKREELKEKYTPEHPAMQSLQRQMEGLSRERQELEAQLRHLPETEQEAVRLTRDVKVANELYLTMLNNGQELKVAKAGTVGNVRIIDTPIHPEEPIKPRRPLILALGVVLGGMLGVFVVLLRRLADRGVMDPEQVESETGYPVYASVLYSEAQGRLAKLMGRSKTSQAKLLARSQPADLAIESLRSLRTSLQFALMKADNNVIAISGPAPGVGKSFVSANFAAVLADAGKRVLLIDGDMRKGHLHQYFGEERRGGLSEVVGGTLPFSEAVRNVGPSLDFLATGTLPPNPAELLMSPGFDELLNSASADYDLVLVDTPPI
uniref:GNVR domain-containing protein n=1 Tax=Thioalkalivibrio sp. TaxID=2093813 RepID=UPI003562815B